MKNLIFSLIIALSAELAFAEAVNPPTYQVGFAPFVGSGSISSGAKVRHTSGYSLSLERPWHLTSALTMAPRVELTNAFFNTRQSSGDSTNISTYDNRIIALGLSLSHHFDRASSFIESIYFSAVSGRSYSKLAVDNSSKNSFVQSQYGGIQGPYVGGELGAFIPLQGSFGINLALLGSQYLANQGDAAGTFEGDRVVDNNLQLVEGSLSAQDGQLQDSVKMRTLALRVGLILGF